MKKHLIKTVFSSIVCLVATAGIATANNVAVGVDVATPNVRVRVGTPAPPPPPHPTIVERERVIIRDTDHHDRGLHKGHYKKHKKQKKQKKHYRHDD